MRAVFHREFIVSGCADDVPPDGLPIVFGFHGGGERLHDESGSGFLDFTNLSALHALVIVPVGNVSNNGHSWINAFPWMKPNPENDLDLPAALIDWIATRPELPRADLRRVYALGKSDGAGMSMALACHRDPRVNLVGVALVSGAYFGLASTTNFGREDHEICLPEFPVRMMMVHGTGDQVMPYSGQNFLNPKALEHADEYWTSIDPTARLGVGCRQFSRTYTADIARYVEALSSQVFHCAGFDERPFGSATTLAVGRECDAPFHVLTISGGNHVWPGHAMSGPDSGKAPNMDFDATAQIARFFSIPMSVVRPLTSTHDFNGDGKSDLVWRDDSGDVAFWLMNGAAVTSSGGTGGVPTTWSLVGQRDFDGDGKADLLWRDTANGNTSIWFMNGTTVASSAGLGSIPINWTVVATGDFNGDGKGDLLWRDNLGNTSVWLMNGASVMSTGGLGQISTNFVVAGTGDFDGDGRTDLLWRDDLGNTSIWFMNGTQVASTGTVGNIPTSWTVVGTGDFDGNGESDIVWRDGSGNTSIWLMNGASVVTPGALGNVPTTWSIALTGDYDGDGKSDLLWRDNLGNTAIWFMNGITVSSTGNIGNIPTTWTVQSVNAQ